MHYRILYNSSVEVTVKACSLEEFMQICNLRMSTFLNDNMVYRVNSRVVWNLRQRRPVSNKQQQKRKKKDYQKTTLVFLANSFLHIIQWEHKPDLETWLLFLAWTLVSLTSIYLSCTQGKRPDWRVSKVPSGVTGFSNYQVDNSKEGDGRRKEKKVSHPIAQRSPQPG